MAPKSQLRYWEMTEDEESSNSDESSDENEIVSGKLVEISSFARSFNIEIIQRLPYGQKISRIFRRECKDFFENPLQYCKANAKILCTTAVLATAVFIFLFGCSKTVMDVQRVKAAKAAYASLSYNFTELLNNKVDLKKSTKSKLLAALKHVSRRLTNLDSQQTEMIQRPVVYLFVSADDENIVELVEKVFMSSSIATVIHFDCKVFASRRELESQLHNEMRKSSIGKLLILENVDSLAAPLLLHSLVDTEYSQFMELAVIATITENDRNGFRIYGNVDNNNECAQLISEFLMSRWVSAELTIEQIHPILSRLLISPVCIQ